MIELLWRWVKDVTKSIWASMQTPQFLDGFLFGIVAVIVVLIALSLFRREWATISVNLPFGLGNISFKLQDADRIVAWKLYVQLKSRKAALPFDEDNDVIIEVYDSLYEMFPIFRELLSALPVSEVSKKSSIADLVLRVQNDGVRPHLTEWQSSFRKWWDQATISNDNKDKTPNEVQQLYPQYAELVKDLKEMNTELTKYAEELLAIAQSPRQSAWLRLRQCIRLGPKMYAPKPPKVKPSPPTEEE